MRGAPSTIVLTVAVAVAACGGRDDEGPGAPTDPLAAQLHAAARAHVDDSPVVPGVSVSVARGNEILLQRGYGHVDLEWDVPTPGAGEASYGIGSVTKQFTAAAILLLAEEGKVDLDADFTDYVDFDTDGRVIPVRRLLDHTSGIESYTEMSVFGDLVPFDLPRDTLLRLVEDEPFRFEPGTALIYNNSAFFILGLIVETVSGMPYEDFVATRLFEPAGMEDSYYCSEDAIREDRAHGYDAAGPESLVRKGYLDHTWPYAAGSLCSTAGDLARWNRALHGGRLLSPESYDAMITPRPLLDGSPVRYAMGIGTGTKGGRRYLAHGGGINGFTSALAWYPEQELSIAVLQNSTGAPGPGALADRLAEIVLGPGSELPTEPFEGDPTRFVGSYTGVARGQMLTVHVTDDGGGLAFRSQGEQAEEPGPPLEVSHLGELRWGNEDVVLRFVTADGRIDELRYEAGSAHYVLRRAAR